MYTSSPAASYRIAAVRHLMARHDGERRGGVTITVTINTIIIISSIIVINVMMTICIIII